MMVRGLVVSMLLVALVGCGQGDDKQQSAQGQPGKVTVKAAQKPKSTELRMRRLNRAVVVLKAYASNLQHGPGYESWTATKMAKRLLSMHQSRVGQVSESFSEGSKSKPSNQGKITYAIGKVTRSWQIVLVPDDDKNILIIEAYGIGTQRPAIIKRVKISHY